MPLGTEVGLGPDHIVLDGDTAAPQKGTASPNDRQSERITVLCTVLVYNTAT